MRLPKHAPIVASILLTAAALVFIFSVIPLDQLLDTLSHADVKLLILAAALHAVNVLFVALRLRAFEPDLPIQDAFLGTGVGLLFSDVTPARSGILASVEYLKSETLGRSRLLRAVIVGQTMDFALKGIILLLLLIHFSNVLRASWLAVVLVVLLVAAGLVLTSRRLFGQLQPLLARLPFVGPHFTTYHANIQAPYKSRQLAWAGTLTVLGFVTAAVKWLLILAAINIQVKAWSFVGIYSLLGILNILPTVGGLGGVESGLVIAGIAGAAPLQLVAFALIDRAVYGVVDAVIGIVGIAAKIARRQPSDDTPSDLKNRTQQRPLLKKNA